MRPQPAALWLFAGAVLLAALSCSRGSGDAPTRPLPDEPTSPPAAASPDVTEATVVAESDAVSGPRPDSGAPAQPATAPATDKAESLELTFVGDVIFGRYRDAGYDPIPEGDYPVFADIADALRADVVVGNLETPVVRELPEGSPIGARYRFGASAAHAKLLVGGGFTAMSLANNHWWDMRREGTEQTVAILRELGIEPLGEPVDSGSPFRVESMMVRGWKVGFVAITTRTNAPLREGMPGFSFLRSSRKIPEHVVPVLEAARDDHDLLVVVVHWGDEYADIPSAAQISAAHAMVDAGASLVVGHHPHVLQGVERYGRGLIAYSMGNFLFENINEPPRLTGVLRVRVDRSRCLQRVLLHPAYIDRKPVKHPAPATGYFGRKVAARIRAVSKPLGGVWDEDGADLALRIGVCNDV